MNIYRAKPEHADAIFILSNKFSANPDDEDSKTILIR